MQAIADPGGGGGGGGGGGRLRVGVGASDANESPIKKSWIRPWHVPRKSRLLVIIKDCSLQFEYRV